MLLDRWLHSQNPLEWCADTWQCVGMKCYSRVLSMLMSTQWATVINHLQTTLETHEMYSVCLDAPNVYPHFIHSLQSAHKGVVQWTYSVTCIHKESSENKVHLGHTLRNNLDLSASWSSKIQIHCIQQSCSTRVNHLLDASFWYLVSTMTGTRWGNQTSWEIL